MLQYVEKWSEKQRGGDLVIVFKRYLDVLDAKPHNKARKTILKGSTLSFEAKTAISLGTVKGQRRKKTQWPKTWGQNYFIMVHHRIFMKGLRWGKSLSTFAFCKDSVGRPAFFYPTRSQLFPQHHKTHKLIGLVRLKSTDNAFFSILPQSLVYCSHMNSCLPSERIH